MKRVRSLVGNILPRFGRLAVITALAAAAAAPMAGNAQGSIQLSQDGQTAASGTIRVTDRVVVMSYRHGTDLVQERLVHRSVTGTFAGLEVSIVHYVIHPDGSATITGTNSCACTVEGRSGTVTFRDRGTVSAAGVIAVHRESIDATGGLAGLSAAQDITGPIAAPTQTYTGWYEFGGQDD